MSGEPESFLSTLALASGAAIAFFIGSRSSFSPSLTCPASAGSATAAWMSGREAWPWSWSFRAPDEPSLARVLTALRDAGIGFRGGDLKDWTPSDEFIALRERGLVSGTFYQFGGNGELCER